MMVVPLTDAAMLALAHELARRLGAGWSGAPDRYEHGGSASLLGSDGAEVGLEQDRWPPSGRGRLVVAGRYPRSKDCRVYGPTGAERARITVAVDRAPEAIAREIARRFLPTYLQGLRETLAAIRDHEDELHEAKRAATSIAAAAGLKPERFGRETWCVRTKDGLIKVRDSREGPHIVIDLHGVDVETAERIARVYKPLAEVVKAVFGAKKADRRAGPR